MQDNKNNHFSQFSKWLESLSPTEFALIATLTGLTIGQYLSQPEQNAIGNWLECVGQILLTASAQGSATLTKPYPNNITVDNINIQIEQLKKEIEHLKSNLKN